MQNYSFVKENEIVSKCMQLKNIICVKKHTSKRKSNLFSLICE